MAGKGELVGGSPNNSIAARRGGSPKKFSHTKHPGGHKKHADGGHGGHKHGPHGKKM